MFQPLPLISYADQGWHYVKMQTTPCSLGLRAVSLCWQQIEQSKYMTSTCGFIAQYRPVVAGREWTHFQGEALISRPKCGSNKSQSSRAGLVFFWTGGGQGGQMTVWLWNEGWVSQKAGDPYVAIAVLNTWLDSPKHIGKLWQVKSCGDSSAVAAMWSPKLAGKWGGEEEVMQNSQVCQKTGELNTSHLAVAFRWAKINILKGE